MFKLKRELDSLRKKKRIRRMLERWCPEDFRIFLTRSKPGEFDRMKINLVLALFTEKEVTARIKEIMKILFQKGADPMLKIPNGSCLASRAFKQSDVEVVTMFLDHLKDINAPLGYTGNRAIHDITQYQNYSFLPIFLSYNPDLDVQDKNGQTALHVAVLERNYPKTWILVNAGANVDIPDNHGCTPIHYILDDARGDESITRLLLDVANVTLKNQRGESPLHLIMQYNKSYVVQTVQKLLDKGADPWESNNFGSTPLTYMLRYLKEFPDCSLEILKKIFESGADINRRDLSGYTLLHMIAESDYGNERLHDFLILLLQYGADPNQVNGSNETVIDIYKYTNHSRGLYLIKYLVLKSYENKFQFGPQLLSSIESNRKFAEFFHICKGVLNNFERISFYGTKRFTMLDVLTAPSTQVLVRYVRNRDFKETMATFDVDLHPAYGYDLKEKFEFGIERYEAEMEAIQYLSGGGLINFECMEGIVQCLPIEELRRIVNN